MIESSNEKKKIFYVAVLVLTLVTLIVGATLAYFALIASQKENGTYLYVGTLEVNYIDGVYIKNPVLYPTKTVTYDTYDNVYRNSFAVNSTGSLDQTISIDLIVSSNTFSNNSLKYVIYNDKGQAMGTGYVPQSGSINLINNVFLSHNDMARYTLIIWLNNSDYQQSFEDSTSNISGKITVYAKQIKY